MFHLNHLLISKHHAALVLQHVLDVLALDAALVDLLRQFLQALVQIHDALRVPAVRCLLLYVPAAFVHQHHCHHVHVLPCALQLATHKDAVVPAQMLLAHVTPPGCRLVAHGQIKDFRFLFPFLGAVCCVLLLS